jgi:hypothetical protein
MCIYIGAIYIGSNSQAKLKCLKLKWPALADHFILYASEIAVLLSTNSMRAIIDL